MEKSKINYDSAEDYNDDYNPAEDYDTQDEYDRLMDKWYGIEDEYRAEFSTITDDDVYFEDGEFDAMMDRVGRRRGKTRREIRDEIQNW